MGTIEISPRTPPPSTIPSGPDIFVPVPTVAPGAERPRKRFDFRPSVGLVEEYTDNFNQSEKGKRSNLRSGVTPGISVSFDDGPITIQGGYNAFAFYDTEPKEAGLHHSLAALAAWQVTPVFRLSVAEGFTKSDEPERADRLNLRRGRQEFTSNTASLTADYIASFLQATAFYRNALFDTTDDETISHTIGGAITRPLSSIQAITLGYEYLRSESDRRQSTVTTTNIFGTPQTQGSSTTTGHQISATFTRDLRKDLSAGITGSYAFRTLDEDGHETDFRRWNASFFSNYVLPEKIVVISSIGVSQLLGGGSDEKLLLTSSSSLTYWFGPAILTLGLERGFSETFATSDNNGVVETFGVSAGLAYRFTPLVTGSIGASRRENKTTGIGQSTGSQSEQTTYGFTAAISYQILRWLSSTLDYTHTEVETKDNAGRGYSENRVRLSLSAIFY